MIDDHSDPDTVARGILGISKRKKEVVSAEGQFLHAWIECLLEMFQSKRAPTSRRGQLTHRIPPLTSQILYLSHP